jgi:hypothetical protein
MTTIAAYGNQIRNIPFTNQFIANWCPILSVSNDYSEVRIATLYFGPRSVPLRTACSLRGVCTRCQRHSV